MGNLGTRFTAMAEWCAAKAGTWQHFGAWVVLTGLWMLSGIPLRFSDTWQLIANTPTTIYELFLGLLILVAAAAAESRDHAQAEVSAKMLEHLNTLVEHLEAEIAALEKTNG